MNNQDLFSIKEASEWATFYLGKSVTTANISYLVNYGKVSKVGDNGSTRISKSELMEYYNSFTGISNVLLNAKPYLVDDYNVFLVANDKYGLYPSIAERAGMQIVNQYKRPVLNRTEKDKGAYSEIIFHLKEK